MSFTELTPAELLEMGLDHPKITERPWTVRWDEAGAPVMAGTDISRLMLNLLPVTAGFPTSGSTGESRVWRRTREQMWNEAGMLADLLAPERPQAVLSFAPPRHLYGALATVMLAARLRVPMWYRPQYFGAMPPTGPRRWAVVAVPWTFSILRRNADWVASAERLSVLHSTAMLPETAERLIGEAGPQRVSLVEVFGSTETGGVAYRRWQPGDPRWELFPDVRFAWDPARHSSPDEHPLTVSGPRLAFGPDGRQLESWEMDDYVVRSGERGFVFSGRRGRLVNLNGRRVNLDELELRARSLLDCQDMAFLPVAHEMSGEHVEMLVVSKPGLALTEDSVRTAITSLGVRPYRVHVVDQIDRSESGKLLRKRQAPSIGAGAAR
ncbi:long-chain fatty acid--CoA ligase [Sphaerisporangium dianthi]|uniref:Long-chain fatty acid--CoA ligase n=1 Tax=Sphaerisporangium dianthi TaxID=1436120 RepID=A0ABV9CU57_9ACTN